MKKISRLLIANRGEIAARIARTVRRMGLVPIVVHSEADRSTLAVREILEGAIGEVFSLGPAPACESYLKAERLLEVAKLSRADAVHPGYGFLSEDSSFARRVLDAGLTWIGPTPEAMERVSSKSLAKALAESVGVPTLSGLRGTQDVEKFSKTAASLGYPLLLKAAAGGGGRGIRKVNSIDELRSQFDLARSEAERSFGNGELLMEKYVERAHHVEVQIFGDDQGNVVHLGDRDCSTQRRHQKIIEETPSQAIDAATREKLHLAAIAIGKAAKYTNAGTVEFLVEGSKYYFLEVNTRLQVEHPVTEAVTGLDLVELQIRIARGEAIPFAQEAVRFTGHAIELRLCAEDPKTFQPSTGRIRAFHFPHDTRVDHFLTQGTSITPFYDSMIAKIVVSAPDRTAAIENAISALDESFVVGVETNRALLRNLLESDEFKSSRLTTRALDEKDFSISSQMDPKATARARAEAVAALAVFVSGLRLEDVVGPMIAWSNGGPRPTLVVLRTEDERSLRFEVEIKGSRTHVRKAGASSDLLRVTYPRLDGLQLVFDEEGQGTTTAFAHLDAGRVHVLFEGVETKLTNGLTQTSSSTTSPKNPDVVLAPMDGVLMKMHAKKGASVSKGETVAILEAMKIQLELKSPRDGRIESVLAETGSQVRNRQPLVKLELSN